MAHSGLLRKDVKIQIWIIVDYDTSDDNPPQGEDGL